VDKNHLFFHSRKGKLGKMKNYPIKHVILSLTLFINSSFALSSTVPIFRAAGAPGSMTYIDHELSADCVGNYSITKRDCSGSDGNAFKLLQDAADQMGEGETILVRGGTYHCVPTSTNNCGNFRGVVILENSGSESNPITFKNYPNENVVIDGDRGDGRFVTYGIKITGDHINVEGFEITNAFYNGIIAVEANHVRMNKITAHHNNRTGGFRAGMAASGGSFISITNSESYLNGFGILINESEAENPLSGVKNCLIENNWVYYNKLANNWGNAAGIGIRFADQCTVRKNVVYYNPDGGIVGIGSTSSLYERNIIFGNYVPPDDIDSSLQYGNSESLKITVRGGGGNIYRYNIILGPAGRGINAARGIGEMFVNNLVYGNTRRPQLSSQGEIVWSGLSGVGVVTDTQSRACFYFNNIATLNNLTGGYSADFRVSTNESILESDNNFWSDMWPKNPFPKVSPYSGHVSPYNNEEPNSKSGDPKLINPSLPFLHFETFDADQSGTVEPIEVITVIKDLERQYDTNQDGIVKPNEIFNDTNQDGFISFDEAVSDLYGRFGLMENSEARGNGISHADIEAMVSSPLMVQTVQDAIQKRITEHFSGLDSCTTNDDCASSVCFQNVCMVRQRSQEVVQLEVLRERITREGFHFLESEEFLKDLNGQFVNSGITPSMGVFEFDPSFNHPPISNAGPDQQIIDTDNNGIESVTLDGSGSRDPDGSITSYVWKNGDTQIAMGLNPTVTLELGVHTLTLETTDNSNDPQSNKGTDTVVITILSPSADPPPPPPDPKPDPKPDSTPDPTPPPQPNNLETGFSTFVNVFNPIKGEEIVIAFKINRSEDISLIIYDRTGTEVKNLLQENRPAGEYKIPWKGRNSKGEVVAAGVYVAVLKVGEDIHTQKVVVLK